MRIIDINMQKLSGYEEVIKLKRDIKTIERFCYFSAVKVDSIFYCSHCYLFTKKSA